MVIFLLKSILPLAKCQYSMYFYNRLDDITNHRYPWSVCFDVCQFTANLANQMWWMNKWHPLKLHKFLHTHDVQIMTHDASQTRTTLHVDLASLVIDDCSIVRMVCCFVYVINWKSFLVSKFIMLFMRLLGAFPVFLFQVFICLVVCMLLVIGMFSKQWFVIF